MALLIAGLVIFFAAHFYSAFRSRVPGKDVTERLGEGPYKGVYSLVSALGLGLIIYGYMSAPPTGNLYVGPEWARHATMTLLLVAFIFLVAAYVPGTHIRKLIKHPMLCAVILWSIGHSINRCEPAESVVVWQLPGIWPGRLCCCISAIK